MARKRSSGRVDSDGYQLVPCPPDHHLAGQRADGMIREHRLNLYEEIGPGTFHCHWCSWPVSWDVVYRADAPVEEKYAALIVDHLDGDRLNNDARNNLRPACCYCNENRGGMQKQGLTFDDVRDVPPWERPRCGNVSALSHALRLRRAVRPAQVKVLEAPADLSEEEPVPDSEYLADESGPAAAPPRAASRPPRRWPRWAAGVAAPLVWAVGGRWPAGVALLLWWLLVAPRVRLPRWLRRRRALAVRGPGPRATVSWDEVIAGLVAADPSTPPPVRRPPKPRPLEVVVHGSDEDYEPDELDDDDEVGGVLRGFVDEEGVPEPLPDLPVLGEEPDGDDEVPDDDPDGGVVVPLRRPGTGRLVGPPPPKTRR